MLTCDWIGCIVFSGGHTNAKTWQPISDVGVMESMARHIAADERIPEVGDIQ